MPVEITVQQHVTTLRLARPERANAYDRALLEALDRAIAGVETPVAVIESAGDRAFCAGADLDQMKSADPLDALDLYSQAVFDRLARAPWISIAAVHGAAVAGGFELAMACDLRVVGPRARFWLPETKLGIIPSAGGSTRLPRLVGIARAKQVILGGDVVSAEQSLAWGLAARLSDDPRAEAAAWAAQIAQRDPVAQRLAKQIIDGALPTDGSLSSERVAEALLYGRRSVKSQESE